MVLIGEGFGVVLDQALVVFDAQKSSRSLCSVGRTRLGDGERENLHGIIGVGDADRRETSSGPLISGYFAISAASTRLPTAFCLPKKL